jgi:aldose sugar dehydrogenase
MSGMKSACSALSGERRTMKQLLLIFLIILASLGFAKIYLDKGPPRGPLSGPVALPEPPAEDEAVQEVRYRVEEVASGLSVPWSMVFTSPDRILVAERGGEIRVIEKGRLAEAPLHSFTGVYSRGESGLLGMAIDPGYTANRLVYAAYAFEDAKGVSVKVVRFIDGGTSVRDIETIIERIPAGNNHAGTRLRFGADGKLYVSTGEGGEGGRAQDMSLLSGKILRIESDGSVPQDNPDPGSPVFARGLRNSQGLDFDPVTGNLWAVDHGPSSFDGPPGGDEINLIHGGGNYGWPVVSHEESADGMEDPKAVYTPAVAPASLLFYRGNQLPGYKNDMFFGGLRGTGLYRVRLSEDRMQVAFREKVPYVDAGRVRDVIEGPDGYIYFSTSNRDGRGNPDDGDDRIFRIIPDTR